MKKFNFYVIFCLILFSSVCNADDIKTPKLEVAQETTNSEVETEDTAEKEGLYILIQKPFSSPRLDSMYNGDSGFIYTADTQLIQTENSIQDVLYTIPGVTTTSSGGRAQLTNFKIRNLPAQQNLVLINGVKVNSPTTGSFNLENIPMEDVESIELLTGAQTLSYGSGATGGILNIKTKKPTCDKNEIFIQAGSYNTIVGGGTFSNCADGFYHTTTVSHSQSQGIDAIRRPSSLYLDTSDKDGYNKNTLASSFGYVANEDFSIKGNLLLNDGKNEYDEYMMGADNTTKFFDINTNLSAEYSISPLLKSITTVQYVQENTKNINSDSKENFGKLKTFLYSGSQEFKFFHGYFGGTAETLMGVEAQRESLKSSDNSYDKTHRNNMGYYLTHMNKIETWKYDLAVRLDDNEQFGTHITYGGNISKELEMLNSVIRVGYNTSYKAPSFNDLYNTMGVSWGYLNNPDLKPEKGSTIEVGIITKPIEELAFSLTYFNSHIKDMIANKEIGPWQYKRVNLEKVKSEGITFGSELKLWKLTFKDMFSLISTKNKETDKYLIAAPKFTNNFTITFMPTDQWSFDLNVHSVSNAYNNLDNTQKLRPYTITSVSGMYKPTKNWELTAAVNNLFNDKTPRSYYNYPNEPYNVEGINFLLGAKYKF